MTAPRHQRKLWPICLTMRLAAGAALVSWLPLPIGATTTEYVVVDRNSGLAISGFDPVAYFTEGVPTVGRGEFEYEWEGAVWRFRNAGTRGAFAADAEVYMPRFGGYDPIGSRAGSRCRATPGCGW